MALLTSLKQLNCSLVWICFHFKCFHLSLGELEKDFTQSSVGVWSQAPVRTLKVFTSRTLVWILFLEDCIILQPVGCLSHIPSSFRQVHLINSFPWFFYDARLILYHIEIKKTKSLSPPHCSFSFVLVTLGDNGNTETRWPEKQDSQLRELQQLCPWPYILGSRCEAGAMEKKSTISSSNTAQDLNMLLSNPDLANRAHLITKDMSCFWHLWFQRQQHS